MDSMQKRFVTRLLGFTTGLLLFLIAAIKLVLLSGSPVRLHEFIQRHIMVVLEDQTGFLYILCQWSFWVLVALLPVLLLVSRLCTRRPVLTLRTGSGYPLKIRESAAKRYVADRLDELGCIEKSKLDVATAGKALRIHIDVWAVSDKPAADIQREIIDAVMGYVQRGLGIEKVVVDPEFVSLRASSPAPVAPVPAASPAVPEPDEGALGARLPLLSRAGADEGEAEERSDADDDEGKKEDA